MIHRIIYCNNYSMVVKYDYHLLIKSLSVFNEPNSESEFWWAMNNYIEKNFEENAVYAQFSVDYGWMFYFRYQEDFVRFQLTWC